MIKFPSKNPNKVIHDSGDRLQIAPVAPNHKIDQDSFAEKIIKRNSHFTGRHL